MRLTLAGICAWECPDMRDLTDQEQETIKTVHNRVCVPTGLLAPLCRIKRRITRDS